MVQKQTSMTLFHAGFLELRNPDIHHGRINADFGQGFYTTENSEFAKRWAKEKKGYDTVINQYVLDLTGLRVHRFCRDKDWFEYIYRNRNRMPDLLAENDVIIGPIANDTIFDTMGIITSGLLSKEDSMKLLKIGPEYIQVVIKTERAAAQLHFRNACIMTKEDLASYAGTAADEEQRFLEEFSAVMESL